MSNKEFSTVTFETRIKEATEKKSVWVNLYKQTDGVLFTSHHETKEIAEWMGESNPTYIKTVEISE